MHIDGLSIGFLDGYLVLSIANTVRLSNKLSIPTVSFLIAFWCTVAYAYSKQSSI